jgi:hypothetical protein
MQAAIEGKSRSDVVRWSISQAEMVVGGARRPVLAGPSVFSVLC